MRTRGRVPARAVDTFAILGYLLGAVYVLVHLWVDPNGRYLALNMQDSFTFEWFLTHATELFTNGESPFFSDDINSPLGVNLMANTSLLTLALPLAPVTLWLGVGVTFAIISTLALAGTAAAWYWVFTRDFGRSRPAALVAGAFLGFAPAMVSQVAGHPNIAGQYLIPLIVAAVLRMRRSGHVWRDGLVLAGLVVAQAGINEEMLFFTAIALGVFIAVYVPWRELPGYAKVILPKCGVTLLVAGAVLAYPLYFQFAGPQTYQGLETGVRSMSLDALSYVTFGRYSIAGNVAEAQRIGRTWASEENSFFGWPLALLLLAGAGALWRNRLARALFITGAVFSVCSLGPVLLFNGVDRTNYPGPWRWIGELPLFDSVVPTRLGLIVTVIVGVGLALMIDRLVVDRLRAAGAPAVEASGARERGLVPALVGSSPSSEGSSSEGLSSEGPSSEGPSNEGPSSEGASGDSPPPATEAPAAPSRRPEDSAPARPRRRAPAIIWGIAILAALVPLFPTPQPAAGRPPLPALFTNGNWRTKLPANPVVAPLPGGTDDDIRMMRWSTVTRFEVKFTDGYFLGPNDTNPADKYAHFGPADRDTVRYLLQARSKATPPEVTEKDRAAMRADLRHWKATTIVVVVGYKNGDVIRRSIDQLVAPEVAPGRIVDGVWLWDVRPITS